MVKAFSHAMYFHTDKANSVQYYLNLRQIYLKLRGYINSKKINNQCRNVMKKLLLTELEID